MPCMCVYHHQKASRGGSTKGPHHCAHFDKPSCFDLRSIEHSERRIYTRRSKVYFDFTSFLDLCCRRNAEQRIYTVSIQQTCRSLSEKWSGKCNIQRTSWRVCRVKYYKDHCSIAKHRDVQGCTRSLRLGEVVVLQNLQTRLLAQQVDELMAMAHSKPEEAPKPWREHNQQITKTYKNHQKPEKTRDIKNEVRNVTNCSGVSYVFLILFAYFCFIMADAFQSSNYACVHVFPSSNS